MLLIKPWANTTLQGFFDELSILIRSYIVRLFDSHFLLVYFSGLKCILAHQIVPAKSSLLDHTICLNSRQSDNNSRERYGRPRVLSFSQSPEHSEFRCLTQINECLCARHYSHSISPPSALCLL